MLATSAVFVNTGAGRFNRWLELAKQRLSSLTSDQIAVLTSAAFILEA